MLIQEDTVTGRGRGHTHTGYVECCHDTKSVRIIGLVKHQKTEDNV